MKVNPEVVYQLVREIAQKLGEENLFNEDPELYIIGLLIVSRDGLRPLIKGAPYQCINDVFERATYERVREEAMRLLNRKKVTSK